MTALKRLRGRIGIWTPGQERIPPLRELGFTRVPEETEGVNLMRLISLMPPSKREIASKIYHIPNGGSRGGREGALFKAQGVRSGVPDYHLPVARGGYHGLYIELKAADGSITAAQGDWINFLHGQGFRAVVAWTAAAAFAEVDRYVSS